MLLKLPKIKRGAKTLLSRSRRKAQTLRVAPNGFAELFLISVRGDAVYRAEFNLRGVLIFVENEIRPEKIRH